MLALALAVALAATAPGMRSGLPPAPRELYRIAWQHPLVTPKALEWKPREPGGVAVDPASGVVLFGTRDGWLHAVRDDGKIAWEFRTYGGFPGPPAVEGETVYAGSSDGRLYAIALRTGKELWRYDAKEEIGTRPAVVDGTVYVASLQDTVFAIDAKTGAWKWHHRREPRPGFTIRGAAPVHVVGGTVYAAYSDGFVAALDRATGSARWERMVAPAGDELDVDGLVVEGDRVYAAAYSGAVVCLEAATGATRWTFDAPGAVKLALAPGGTVVAVATAGVYALSTADGPCSGRHRSTRASPRPSRSLRVAGCSCRPVRAGCAGSRRRAGGSCACSTRAAASRARRPSSIAACTSSRIAATSSRSICPDDETPPGRRRRRPTSGSAPDHAPAGSARGARSVGVPGRQGGAGRGRARSAPARARGGAGLRRGGGAAPPPPRARLRCPRGGARLLSLHARAGGGAARSGSRRSPGRREGRSAATTFSTPIGRCSRSSSGSPEAAPLGAQA